MTSDKKMIPAVSVPVETATDSVSNGTQSLVTVQFSRLSQLLNTWAEANDFQTPK